VSRRSTKQRRAARRRHAHYWRLHLKWYGDILKSIYMDDLVAVMEDVLRAPSFTALLPIIEPPVTCVYGPNGEVQEIVW
jgi:hypothetical protein